MAATDDGASSAASQLLARGMRVLEALSESPDPVGVGELARDVDLPKSTVQRILRTLEQLNWVESIQDPHTRWLLTDRMRLLGQRAPRAKDLRSTARPYMRRLGLVTREAIQLATLNRSLAATVLIERVDSTQPVRTHNEIGTVVPLYAGAVGTAILAALPAAEAEAMLTGSLTKITSSTVTDKVLLRRRLNEIRRVGYAVSRGEFRAEICAVGAAILDEEGNPTGGLTISMPETRFDAEQVPEWGRLLTDACRHIEQDLRD
jgi:IclR family acetate operon transcriptional repressor